MTDLHDISWSMMECTVTSARVFPSDKQTAANEQSSVFEEIVSVIMSPALDVNEDINVDPNRQADNRNTDVGIVTRRMKKKHRKETNYRIH